MSNCQHDPIWMSWSHPWPISFLWQCTLKPATSELPNITRLAHSSPSTAYNLPLLPSASAWTLIVASSLFFCSHLPPHPLFFIGLSREIPIKPKPSQEFPGGPGVKIGYSPWGRKESDMTEQLHFHFALITGILTLFYWVDINEHGCKIQKVQKEEYSKSPAMNEV